MPKSKNQELPGVEGEGVSKLEIPDIEKAIAKYEKKKEARCAESPGEVAAKKELSDLLHTHRDKLPKTGEGVPFYRGEDRDYMLVEKMTIKKHAEVDEDEE